MPKMEKYKDELLNEFESRTDEWSYGSFENRLSELRKGTSYLDAKGIINDAHHSGKWPRTVKRYLITNYKVFGNASNEYGDTFNSIYNAMSDTEKSAWGLG
ncbi:hypothetical protein [Psychromonas sp. MB-3u-54]|uniref:hypothetical protein n=1 Tax=Psychromonas sp. MB-3u-54 TaxID=2058319 RepID=UPI001E497CAF|nr:hypothetical protein [Psychromonas sp. MB-3u-54]